MWDDTQKEEADDGENMQQRKDRLGQKKIIYGRN
jgi:hypothetical protein